MIPEMFIIAGPNGAGKSTTASVLLPENLSIKQFVNADLIARGLSPFAPGASVFEAGRIMLHRMHELRKRRESFAFETTLAARCYVRFIRSARAEGYSIHLIFIWISSVELALSRVALRVRQGGHDVPADVVERRYWRGLSNFFDLYQPMANTWTLCDNSGSGLRIVARGTRGRPPAVANHESFARIRAQATHGR